MSPVAYPGDQGDEMHFTESFNAIAVGVLTILLGVSIIYQLNRLGKRVNQSTDISAERQLKADLEELREEHRLNQARLKSEIQSEIDSLRRLQNEMSESVNELKTVLGQLAELRGGAQETT